MHRGKQGCILCSVQQSQADYRLCAQRGGLSAEGIQAACVLQGFFIAYQARAQAQALGSGRQQQVAGWELRPVHLGARAAVWVGVEGKTLRSPGLAGAGHLHGKEQGVIRLGLPIPCELSAVGIYALLARGTEPSEQGVKRGPPRINPALSVRCLELPRAFRPSGGLCMEQHERLCSAGPGGMCCMRPVQGWPRLWALGPCPPPCCFTFLLWL